MHLPKIIAGIDISKHTLDIAITSDGVDVLSYKIKNSENEIDNFFKEVRAQYRLRKADLAICAEDMGIYAKFLQEIAARRGLNLYFESALHIKRSLGLQRGKSDKADAKRIAQFARKNYPNLRKWIPRSADIQEIKDLLTIHKRLLKVKVMLVTSGKTEKYYLTREQAQTIASYSAQSLKAVISDSKVIDHRIKEIIRRSERLSRLLEITTSVPGIGNKIAVNLLVHTNEFQDFSSPKKFASYCGIAPFPWSSGLSKGRSKVSPFANKELKVLLHLAALVATRQKTGSLAKYYEKKVAEGKNKMSILNALRNKLIHRVFACVASDQLYEDPLILRAPE